MSEEDSEAGRQVRPHEFGSSATQQAVYVLPADALATQNETGLDLVELLRVVCAGKWIVAGITALTAGAAIAYALLATEWYRAEVLLAPATDAGSTGLVGQLGDIASLAGFSLGEGGTAEPIAVLESRELARGFIEELNLVQVLLADQWDSEAKRWKNDDPEKWPDIRDAVEYFNKNVRSVQEDLKTGLVTVVFEWTDPELASEWANLYVKRLNDRMRNRAITEAEANIRFLQAEGARTNIVTLQEASGRLLQTELQKLMAARGNEEFSFRVVDKAEVPKRRSRPKRALLVVLATVLGGIAGVLTVVTRRAFRS